METKNKPCWFVGACFGGKNDQSQRFLSEGIWEINNPTANELAHVKSMSVGDRIAIKSTYIRKHGLPFDNHGEIVSVMGIKATGTIRKNPGNGQIVEVDWEPSSEPREWYFYTYRATIWRVLPGEWMPDGLIEFAFDRKPQDIDRFRNDPFWRERFGTLTLDKRRFEWTKFYEDVADKLLTYRNNRQELVRGIRDISLRVDAVGHLAEDQFADGTKGFVRDICPFTTMALFNRGIKDSNRKIIAAELAQFLGVEEAVPETFEGIPVLFNLASWFFGFEKDRPADHIDALWDIFASAIKFADSDEADARPLFATAYNNVNGRPAIGWNLTIGLYWIRPWSFLSLDNHSQSYITKKLGIPIGMRGPKGRCNADDYLALMDNLESRFKESSYSVHSYPELSLEAWLYKDPTGDVGAESKEHAKGEVESGDIMPDEQTNIAPIVPYNVENILNDGCFFDSGEIERLLDRLRSKKNLILQGPPGTGKTWLAKRLAFALMGQKDESKVRAVQFHPNLSYEDFVRGWRPTGEGKLSLTDGVFMEAIKAAAKESSSKFVVVIEEINRGNPAQIFGELLTLLEAGKRTPNEALELCYPDEDGKRRPVHIPENLYVIGTMNIADRSLALVDLALRRRFAFVTLEPRLGECWRKWVVKACNVDQDLVEDIEGRIVKLNDQIAADARLGKQFRIGHSYVTPSYRLETGDTKKWFRQVVETEIGPLLEEYWFDAPKAAQQASDCLLQSW